MVQRRHLPIVSQPNAAAPKEPDADDDDRPAWHWIGFGAVAVFIVWLPLAYVAQMVAGRVVARMVPDRSSPEAVAQALSALSQGERLRIMAIMGLPNALAFAIASFAGGWLVGRFAARAGAKEAALSGACAALIAVVLAWGGLTLATLVTASVLVVVAMVFAGWGGHVGSKRAAGRAM